MQNSQSQVILWLLEELGIDYNLNLFERETSGPRKSRAPVSLKQTHPLGKSPQLITVEGRVITERSAIAKYLIEKYDTEERFRLNSTDSENDAIREDELISLGGTTLQQIFMIQTLFNLMKEASPFFVKPLIGMMATMVSKGWTGGEVDLLMVYVDEHLKGKEYFMGTANITRVDICWMWWADLGKMAGNDLSKYSNFQRWVDRCKARPAWKRSLEKGNGYSTSMNF